MITSRNLAVVGSLFAIIVMVAGCTGKESARGGKPSYVVKRTTQKISVDGNIFEQDWEIAQTVGDFVFPWYEKGEKEQTDARLLWDDKYLYIHFRCEDEHISAHHYQRNDPVSRDDCVEAFISSNSDEPLWYANYEINCLGTWLVGLHKGEESRYWEPDGILVSRGHMGTINKEDDVDSHWILEIAIPFENLHAYGGQIPPQDGDVWGLTLNRCGGDVNPQYSQWTASQTPKPNFHKPQDFGRLVFSDENVR